jgi:hypothetical protein
VAVTVSPAAVVVAAMVSMMTWWLASGRARQVRVMWQNSRCPILFHLEVPGGKWQTVIECVRYFVRGAFRCPVPGVYP